MKPVPLANYIYMGTALRFLQDCDTSATVKGDGGLINNIDRLLAGFQNYAMPVSDRAAAGIKNLKEELKKYEPDQKLTTEKAAEIKKLASDLRNTIGAEALGIYVFMVGEKFYQVDKLLNCMEELIGRSVYQKMPEVARFDFDEAGKCIAFERPTASAFHMLRGTEDVLKHFYLSAVKRGRLKVLTMGSMSKHLKERKIPGCDFLGVLDIIRTTFRNPTQHPEKIYSMEETQRLFPLCCDTISKVVKHAKYENI